ncbi:MAG: hypothetical protein FJZ57_07930 [Chlamydiae bacterium]|nr:hypothetical protein [Chlamydiota bacterium]
MDINKSIISKESSIDTHRYNISHAEKTFSIPHIGSLIAVHLNSKDKVALAICSKSMFYNIKDITKSEVTTACKAIAKKIKTIVPKSEKERKKLAENHNRIVRFLNSIHYSIPEYNLSYIPFFQDMACDILLNTQLTVSQIESDGLYKSAFTNEIENLPLQITSVNHELQNMTHKVSSLSFATFIINSLLYLTKNDYNSLYKNKVLSIIDLEIKKKHFLIAERIIDLYGKFFMGNSTYLEKLLIECERSIGFTETKRVMKKGFNSIKQGNRIPRISINGSTNFLALLRNSFQGGLS